MTRDRRHRQDDELYAARSGCSFASTRSCDTRYSALAVHRSGWRADDEVVDCDLLALVEGVGARIDDVVSGTASGSVWLLASC